MKVLSILLFLVPLSLVAQKELKTIEVSDTILSITIDRPGDLYVITQGGHYQRLNENGELEILYKHIPPTLFDPHDGSRLFAYYRAKQEYAYLNPSFQVSSGFRVDSAFVIQPWLICPSGDHKLWMLDVADHRLKKINVQTAEVEVEAEIELGVINDVKTISTMRDYQGFVFLLRPGDGIYIFSRMGKHVRTIKSPTISSFNFIGEELYYPENGKIVLFDLFTAETREIAVPGVIKGDIIISEHRLFAASPTSVTIYEFKL
ncbi:MAG TPA: hypothetical protein VD927_10425 [Chryseosolibacter sp.]|nr:hypothetical protein [Chryseosolibacter sp.]